MVPTDSPPAPAASPEAASPAVPDPPPTSKGEDEEQGTPSQRTSGVGSLTSSPAEEEGEERQLDPEVVGMGTTCVGSEPSEKQADRDKCAKCLKRYGKSSKHRFFCCCMSLS